MFRYVRAKFRRSAQLTRGLTPSQRPAQLLGNLWSGRKNRREVSLCELVNRGWNQCADRRRGGRPGQQSDLSKMIPRSDAQQLHLALNSRTSERKDAVADDEQRLQNDAGFNQLLAFVV